VRHREFTKWIEKNARGWQLERVIPNRFSFDPERPDETSHSDFYLFASSSSS
jgi:hypothetical protein